MGPYAASHIEQTVNRMRREDTEFITAATVAQFDGCPEAAAETVLLAMGFTPEQIGPVGDISPLDRRDIVGEDGREFAVIRSGRRWTRVAEFLTNGQITARFFLDEATGEARAAESWKSPKSWRLPEETAQFVRELAERGR